MNVKLRNRRAVETGLKDFLVRFTLFLSQIHVHIIELQPNTTYCSLPLSDPLLTTISASEGTGS